METQNVVKLFMQGILGPAHLVECVDCDCCAVAEDPCIADIGVLSSLDPIAIDQACIYLVYNSDDPKKGHLIERIESRNGTLTIEKAHTLGYGTKEYELISID